MLHRSLLNALGSDHCGKTFVALALIHFRVAVRATGGGENDNQDMQAGRVRGPECNIGRQSCICVESFFVEDSKR